MSLRNLLFNNKLMRKIKQKRCKDCIYAFKSGSIFACYTGTCWYDFKIIRPTRLICFKRKKYKRKE